MGIILIMKKTINKLLFVIGNTFTYISQHLCSKIYNIFSITLSVSIINSWNGNLEIQLANKEEKKTVFYMFWD